MKTLEEFYRELIDDIFRSFSEDHRKHLNLMFRGKTVEWLRQNRQEIEKRIANLKDEPTDVRLLISPSLYAIAKYLDSELLEGAK